MAKVAAPAKDNGSNSRAFHADWWPNQSNHQILHASGQNPNPKMPWHNGRSTQQIYIEGCMVSHRAADLPSTWKR